MRSGLKYNNQQLLSTLQFFEIRVEGRPFCIKHPARLLLAPQWKLAQQSESVAHEPCSPTQAAPVRAGCVAFECQKSIPSKQRQDIDCRTLYVLWQALPKRCAFGVPQKARSFVGYRQKLLVWESRNTL